MYVVCVCVVRECVLRYLLLCLTQLDQPQLWGQTVVGIFAQLLIFFFLYKMLMISNFLRLVHYSDSLLD